MGEVDNQLVGLQGLSIGLVERYKFIGMGSFCYLVWGLEFRVLIKLWSQVGWVREGILRYLQVKDIVVIFVRDLVGEQDVIIGFGVGSFFLFMGV